MGMDVYGKAPTDERGKYFRNNVWWWHGIPNYIEKAHPDLYAKCKHWHSNDGDGLNAEDSAELAKRLKSDIDSGRVAEFAANWRSTEDGHGRPFYHFDVDNIREFADFLTTCGGFEIL